MSATCFWYRGDLPAGALIAQLDSWCAGLWGDRLEADADACQFVEQMAATAFDPLTWASVDERMRVVAAAAAENLTATVRFFDPSAEILVRRLTWGRTATFRVRIVTDSPLPTPPATLSISEPNEAMPVTGSPEVVALAGTRVQTADGTRWYEAFLPFPQSYPADEQLDRVWLKAIPYRDPDNAVVAWRWVGLQGAPTGARGNR